MCSFEAAFNACGSRGPFALTRGPRAERGGGGGARGARHSAATKTPGDIL